jgi:hypothetical protein
VPDDLARPNRALARTLGEPSAAIAATHLTAKLVGLLVDRKEQGSLVTSPACGARQT